MTPGPPLRLTCPHCGGYKYICSLASGNTFGGIVWSDSKHDFPMMPEASDVQYCPKCKKYFFYDDAKPESVPMTRRHSPSFIDALFSEHVNRKARENDKQTKEEKECEEVAHKNGFGLLTFKQADSAFRALYSNDLTEEKKSKLLFLWLFAFNDKFGGRTKGFRIDGCPTEVQKRHKVVLNELIEISTRENNLVFVAELYRELGEFDKSKEIAASLMEGDDDNAIVAKQIYDYADKQQTNVFQIVFPR